ncbi:MAG: alpha/beta fold hydrolase [Schleiferiaceae bacterium]
MPTPILLLHGALGSQAQLQKLKSDLLTIRPDSTLHTLDFTGHGARSDESGEYSMEAFAKDVLDFIEERKWDSIDIFGYSMGGYVALTAAISHSNKINRIATLGTKFHWTPESAAREVKMLNPEIIEEKVPAFASGLKTLHGADHWKSVLERTAQMMLDLGNGKALKTEMLKDIRLPVLIGIGDQDRMVTMEESEERAHALPQGEIIVMEGFRHEMDRVDTYTLAETLNAFFEK